MKQHITKEQWDELEIEQQLTFLNKIDGYTGGKSNGKQRFEMYYDLATIGQMIEFLGDDWQSRLPASKYKIIIFPKNEELADALWEAVKEKLING